MLLMSDLLYTVRGQILAAIIFGGFENITDLIWRYYWNKVGGVHIYSFGDY